MGIKIRRIPEDFKVFELNKFNILKRGKYKLYLLKKKNLETFDLVDYLSRTNQIPRGAFGIAGLKDKHAVTEQYLTLDDKYELKILSENNFSLILLGYLNNPIKIGDLRGNRFEIIIRGITGRELHGISTKCNDLSVPNYYDSQRFGSVHNKDFIIKYIIKKDYETAVKIYLTSFSKFEIKKIKQDKILILNNWGKPVKLKTRCLSHIVDTYQKTRDWLKAYQKIPANAREMFVFAYQSYLWNECIKLLLKKHFDKHSLYSVKYNVGSLLFFKQSINGLPKSFQTLSSNMQVESYEKEIIKTVLEKEKLDLKDFDINISGNFFKTYKREIIIAPANISISSPTNDEFLRNKYKIKVCFTLPKGSYATIIIKRLFNF